MKYTLRPGNGIRNIHLKNTEPEFVLTDQLVADDLDEMLDSDEQIISKLKSRIFTLEVTIEKVREESFHAGFQEGKKTTETELREKFETIPAEFAKLTQSLQDQYNDAIRNMETPILRLAFKIAQKIISNQIEPDKNQNEFLKNQIRRFLEIITDNGKVTIFVHPQQLGWIGHQQLKEGTSFTGNITFKPNSNLNPGECLLETDEFIVDGTILGQLERIEKQLFN
jgi:flagellar assembly protein FliH